MRRQIVYPGQVPLETDTLNTNRNVMIALGKLAGALLGTGGLVNGLAVAPTQPASLSVQVGAGEIYQLENVDNTAYSSLPLDTTDTCLKQGIQLQPVNIAIAPPNTAGYSQCYLIEATFQENDINNVVLPYYNSSNPNQALNGPPGNPGQQQPTQRDGQVILQAKAGIAAATGTQVAPAVDPGYIALAVVTVANGQATITAANISVVTAGVLPASLLQALQNNSLCYAKDVGAVNALVVNLQPAPTALVDGMLVETQVAVTNTGATTLNLNGLGAKPILGAAHAALQGGELPAGGKAEFMWHAGLASWILIEETAGAQQLGAGSYVSTPAQFDSSTKVATTAYVQSALGSFSGQNNYAAPKTLSAADVGKLNIITSTGTVTLPLAGQMPPGALIVISPASGNITVQAQGADVVTRLGTGVSGSVTIQSQTVAVFRALASQNGWSLDAGDAALSFSPLFSSGLTTPGYQKWPSGLILQWGVASSVSGSATTVTYPIAFPNATLNAWVTCFIAGAGAIGVIESGGSTTQLLVGSWASNSTRSGAGTNIRWFALGY